MKTIRITIDEDTAAWARAQAASRGMSLSRFVGEVLRRGMSESREYECAMRRYLAKRPLPLSRRGGRYPTRGERHER